MDFLVGLQKALAQGITKEDYTDIWKKETELKIYNSKAQNNASEGATSVDAKSDKDCAEMNTLVPLLKQIAEKQDRLQQQQISIQQQVKQLQIVHAKGQQQLQQQFEEAQKGLSEKVIAIEASLANLQPTLEVCVRETAHSESQDIKEKLSNMSQTFHNHLLEEMRKVAGVSKTVNKAEKSKVLAEKKAQILEENAGKDITTMVDREDDNDGSIDLSFHTIDNNDSVEKIESLLVESQTDTSSDRNVCSPVDDENSNSLKGIVHCELNTFLVDIQKLLLKPINSEDVSHHTIEQIKEFLRGEKNLTSEQLLDVQTAISGDVQARLYRLEMCLKNEISKIVSILEHNEKSDVKVDMILEEIENIKCFISSELPSRIVSHPKWASIFEKGRYMNAAGGILNEDRVNNVVRSDYSHEQDGSRHVNKPGRNLYGYTVSDVDTQVCVEESCSEQVQAIMLMLSMHVLMLLTGHDTKTRERTPGKAEPRRTTTFLIPGDTDGRTNTLETGQQIEQPETDIFHHLTDEHLQFMFRQHKPTNFLFDLNYSTLSADEEVFLKMEDIAPGYNLQLKSFISETKNVNFYIHAISGTKDDSLLWPANFNITITLVNKQPLAVPKPNHWHSFTKSKQFPKPNKMTSRAIPLCYFRDDIVNRYVYDETLTFKVSVSYVGREEDIQE